MRNRYGYGSYHGQSRTSSVLKGIAIFLAALLVLVVLAVLFLGQYVVYSADGARLELPFFQGSKPAPTQTVPAVEPTPTLVIVTPEPTPPPQLHVAALPRAALADGTAMSQMEAAGANAVWFDMKADDGTLGYVSSLDLAVKAKTSAADPALNEAIKTLNTTEGLYTVARVSCFKDDLLSNADYTLNILTNSGYRWTDPQKLHWSSPASDAVRTYITGVCRELAALGFDEIVLDNAGYPTDGNLGYIKKGPLYNLDQLDNVVGTFYAQVKESLAAYPDVTLSIVAAEAALDGSDSRSGQTAGNVAASARRVWIAPPQKEGADYISLLTQAGMTVSAENIVSIVPKAISSDFSWAIWPE
ncbi:MAG: hypothetical protein EOM52_02135 [Clostridia bacterium]|nr:hypothetical protein [Clostridia bacterium]